MGLASNGNARIASDRTGKGLGNHRCRKEPFGRQLDFIGGSERKEGPFIIAVYEGEFTADFAGDAGKNRYFAWKFREPKRELVFLT